MTHAPGHVFIVPTISIWRAYGYYTYPIPVIARRIRKINPDHFTLIIDVLVSTYN